MRRHRLAVLALIFAFGSAAAVAVQGQESPRVRVRIPAGVVVTHHQNGRADTIVIERRGRMGILVDLRADPARDTIGARISGVTPGGPAARAGAQTGDLITRVNGTRLVSAEAGRLEEADQDQSRPGIRLLRIASRLDPGDTVRLDIQRDSRPVTLTFVAEESDVDQMVDRMAGTMVFDGPMRLPGGGMPPGMEGQMRAFIMGGPIADLELVKVNPGLGEYFGAQDGLLVVSVGQDSALGLRAGDVILSIGGRRPASPPQAMRILGTYEPEEAVQFEVMRQHRRVSVSGKIPQRGDHGWSIRRNNFEFDMPNFEFMLPQMRERHPGHVLIRMSGEV